MGPIYQVGANPYCGVTAKSMRLGSSDRQLVRRSNNVQRIIHHPNGNICYIILKDDRILVIAGNNHAMLEIRKDQQRGYGWKYQFEDLRENILNRKVDCLIELIHQMNGIATLRSTRLSWYL